MIFRAYDLEMFIAMCHLYGRSNDSVMLSILQRLSELQLDKFIDQFRETLSATLKKIKNHARALAVITKSHFDKSGLTNTEPWPARIRQSLDESTEETKDLFVLAKFFPNVVASSVWANDVLIVLSNYYLMIKEYKVEVWENYVFEKRWLNESTNYVKKLLFKTIVMYLKRLYFGIIGNWGTGFVQKQNELSKALTNYILEMTGNQVIHKDSVPSNSSIIEQKGGAHAFLKKIMKVVEFEPFLFQIEDRAIPNREL